DIEQTFRSLGIRGMSESDVENIGNIVRNGLDSSLKTVTDYISDAKKLAEETAFDKAVEDYDRNYIEKVNDYIAQAARDGRYTEEELDILTEHMFMSYLDPIDGLLKQRMSQVQRDLIEADRRDSSNPFMKGESFEEVKKREQRINEAKEKLGKTKISKLFTNTLHKENSNSQDFMAAVDEIAERFGYETVNNKDDFAAAMSYVDKYGAEQVETELRQKIDDGLQWTEKDTMKMIAAKAQYEYMSENASTYTERHKYQEAAADLAADTSEVLRTNGRAIQALAIMNSITPEGQIIKAEKQIEAQRNEEVKGRSDAEKVNRDIKAAEAAARRARREYGRNEANDAAMKRLEKEAAEYKQKSRQLENEIFELEGSLRRMRAEYPERDIDREELADARDTNRQAQDEKAEAERSEAEIREEIRQINSETEKLSRQREKIEQCIPELEKQFDEAEKQLNSKYADKKEAQKKYDAVKQALDDVKNELKKTNDRIKRLENKTAENKQKIGITNEMLGDAQKLEADMRPEAEEVERRLKEKRRELAKYRKEYKQRIKNALRLRELNTLSPQAKAAQDALEAVYKKYGLPYVSAETKGMIDNTLYNLQLFKDDPAAIIEIIMENSRYRNTGTDPVLKKNLEWLGRVQGVQILEDVAVNQLIGMISDSAKVSIGKKAGSLMRQNMLSAPATWIRNVVTNLYFNGWDKRSSNYFGRLFDYLVSSRIAGA
ncbi:MAG: hypothetical protein ACI38A_03635, partial [Candidatus Ornithomonoglobus sp.]